MQEEKSPETGEKKPAFCLKKQLPVILVWARYLMPVITGAAEYPEKILEKLSEVIDLTAVDALALAREAGNAKSVNVVLIGVMAKNTDIPYEEWVETIKTTVPAKFLEANLKAFDLGYHL